MNALSLYELNLLVREAIKIVLPNQYWVEAELMDVRESRGHCYMELVQKDELSNTPIAKASAKCWKNTWMFLRPKFENVTGQYLRAGMKVLLKVSAQFHESYGFSWIISDIDPTYTMGDIARKRLEIIQQLKQEGVFDLQKTLTIPMFAQRIAVISSATAAGYGDFCNQLNNNSHGFVFQTTLFQSIMQGEGVSDSIIKALNKINRNIDAFDVVVIIRGGGSTSDLSGFDTLDLAENVANFPLPIITGIGHERDESILDMISNKRVKTPTAAAEFLIENLKNVKALVEDFEDRITQYVVQRIQYEKNRIERLTTNVRSMFSLFKTSQLAAISQMSSRINVAVSRRLSDERRNVDRIELSISPSLEKTLTHQRHHIELLEQRAISLDPKRMLKRGFSVTLKNGHVVRNASQLKQGDVITTIYEKGKTESTIK